MRVRCSLYDWNFEGMKRVFEYTADEKCSGMLIKDFLKKHYNMSTNLITALKKHRDGICVNGEHKRVTHRLSAGEKLVITMYDTASENIVPAEIPIDIVYEDEDIAVVNKPPKLPTHPSMGNFENTLANAMMYHWLKNGEEHIFRAVNRLDKDTSGIMVVAKNMYSHAQLSEQLQNGALKRKYYAVVCGTLENGGSVNAPIRRENESVIKRCVAPDGQPAVTHYSVAGHYGGYTLTELELETGRTHQIRVHMSHIGYPLLGDWLYGEENHDLIDRVALHSAYAEFYHPVTKEKMVFSCAVPADIADFLKKTV